ncbi:phosphatidate cytidylyltransferase [Bacillus mesophilus]|uniref:Phosphatidate cytidylyltransferase n=1 Tax=Bacillus mesophilus TaxID=1808955 RepID=A0A6M0Q1K5_9BACI|nr:phosphatidate cytidylyltransferase [Bacillus mesophilus]MBM7659329.1 phosphatidate cytidylyltransferase [Bacillus mesophilus]NEY70201.1 phosphatidate cytidylyltransferase [Bacillus mesophilus]
MIQRILTAVLAAAIFLPFVIIGGLPFTIFIYLLASIAIYELLKMKKISLLSFPGILSLVLIWVLLYPNTTIDFLTEVNISKVEIALLAVVFLLSYTVVTKNQFTFDHAAFIILATIYIGTGFYYFIQINEQGLKYLFFAMFVIWATDSGAYFVGRAMGKRKLWPEISPNKTIEGSVGGILCALVVAIIFQAILPISDSFVMVIIITILLSIFGQIGDLVESALKRHYSVKDSGTLLPGHGGILDRFDSLLFVLPIFYFLQFI